MVTNPSSSGFNADASQGASFYFADLIDEPLTLEDLEVFLAAERANAELWNSAAAENIDDTPPPPPGSNFPGGDYLGDPDPDPADDGPRHVGSNPNIAMFTAPNEANATDAGNFARLAQWNADRLVVALDPAAAAEAESDIYGVDERGMLSGAEFHAAVLATGRRYIVEAFNAPGDKKGRFVGHALKLRDAGTSRKLRAVAAGVIAELRAHRALPAELVVKTKADIDADLSVLGTPRGVLDLRSGKILPPVKAREFFVLSSTGVHYDPSAQHDLIDEILPPVDSLTEDSPGYFRARVIAFGMLRKPQREFLVEICDEASGKSSFVNALLQGLGSSYIQAIRKEALQPPKYLHGATAHNGDLRRFKAPARFIFAMEWSSSYDRPLVKSVSGGDVLTMRRISQEDEQFRPTAHLWLMGNSGEDCDAVLGVGGRDADSRAIRDRAKLLTRTKIPEGLQVKSVVDLATPQFKTAALARIVEYTMAFWNLDFPKAIPSFAGLMDKQALAETPVWQREWLPGALVPVPPPPAGAGIVAPALLGTTNREIFEDLRAWFDQFGEGELPSARAVGKALVDHYGVARPRKTTIQDPASIHVKFVTAYRYIGWQLRG